MSFSNIIVKAGPKGKPLNLFFAPCLRPLGGFLIIMMCILHTVMTSKTIRRALLCTCTCIERFSIECQRGSSNYFGLVLLLFEIVWVVQLVSTCTAVIGLGLILWHSIGKCSRLVPDTQVHTAEIVHYVNRLTLITQTMRGFQSSGRHEVLK